VGEQMLGVQARMFYIMLLEVGRGRLHHIENGFVRCHAERKRSISQIT
jgi:hypothetical protein